MTQHYTSWGPHYQKYPELPLPDLTLGVKESKQLSAQLGVGHGFLDEGFLLSQLLGTEVLCLSSHPVVVVQHSQESSVGGSGE